MKETFADTFGFACHWEEDATAEKMKQLVKQVAACNYKDSYEDIRYIVVVFSGHGGEGTLQDNDGKEIEVNYIIESLKPANMPNASKEIVELFFFDACRGDSVMAGMPKGDVKPHPGKYLVAYSTYRGFVSWPRQDGKGSEWMPDVAESLQVRKDLSIHDAISVANDRKNWHQCPEIRTIGGCGAIKLHEDILGDHASAPTEKTKPGAGGGKADPGPKDISDLTNVKDWLRKQSIAGFIALQKDHECNDFATMLLGGDDGVVDATRQKYNDNNSFVRAILSLWIKQQGEAVPRTWKELIRCMKAVGLNPYSVEIIEKNLL